MELLDGRMDCLSFKRYVPQDSVGFSFRINYIFQLLLFES
jgi:hypothetical protein